MVKLKRATGGLAAKPQGNGGGQGKLAGLKDWVARRIGRKPDLTAAELAAEIAATHGMQVHRGSVWRLLRRVSDLLCIGDLVHAFQEERGR